ncbi:MAG: (2Fe-2S) ferredoxin domain-containing protein [bacterium JZ-2024 1]
MREVKRQVFVCTKESFEGCCAQKGAAEVFQRFREELRSRGITGVVVTGCGCTGQHATGPTVIVYPDGIWYGSVKPEDVPEIIDRHLLGGIPLDRLVNPNIRLVKE